MNTVLIIVKILFYSTASLFLLVKAQCDIEYRARQRKRWNEEDKNK